MKENCPYDNECSECNWKIKSVKYSNCFLVYKLFINKSHTVEEIAKMLDIKEEDVERLEMKALSKLKEIL